MHTVDVIIPVFHPGNKFSLLLDKMQQQTVSPSKVIIIHTIDAPGKENAVCLEDSFDSSISIFRAGMNDGQKLIIQDIPALEFDHGASRNLGVSLSDAEAFVMMTQDAIPDSDDMIEQLLLKLYPEQRDTAGDTENVITAVAYGRQLAAETSAPEEKFSRLFNYPDKSCFKTSEDISTLGIKTFFCSNVCAAYRRDIFDELGGFVSKTIFNEDMIFAGTAIQHGYSVAYAADARVIHSHNYSCMQQFRRNFDLGVSQAEHPEIFAGIHSESEGKILVAGTAQYLRECKKSYRLPYFLIVCVFRYAGFSMGKRFRRLSKKTIMNCTMNRVYWK